jgi:hypothetical protein
LHLGRVPGQAEPRNHRLSRAREETVHTQAVPNGDGGQRSSGERMNARPQVNLLTRNQQLAQQLELNFQQGQSNQDPQVEFATSNRR